MNALIKTSDELHEWLCSLNKLNEHHLKMALKNGVYVSTKIRREYLCSESQGRFILKGESVSVKFENVGGGVYRVGVMK